LTNTQAVPTKVDEILNLRQLVQLPIATESLVGKSSGSASVLPEAAAATKPKKQQPKGLRMRYRPSGFGSEDPGTIGFSDSDELKSRGAPHTLNGHSKPTKKRKDREEDATVDTSEKAQKKKKKHGSTAENVLATVNSESTQKNQKHKERPVENNSVMEDIVQHVDGGKTHKKKKKHKDREDEDAVMEDAWSQTSQLQSNGVSKKSKYGEIEVPSKAPKVNGVHLATVDDAKQSRTKDKEKKKKKKRDKENA
jgi:hypothetical protein